MNASISSSGRVCLCEWSGPVTVTMAASLFARLKQAHGSEVGAILLILHLRPASARSVLQRAHRLIEITPALWAHCQEIAIACEGEQRLLDQLRRCLCGSASLRGSQLARPLSFFELLDDAFTHAQGLFPHDVLELRRQRLRSGTWSTSIDGDVRQVK